MPEEAAQMLLREVEYACGESADRQHDQRYDHDRRLVIVMSVVRVMATTMIIRGGGLMGAARQMLVHVPLETGGQFNRRRRDYFGAFEHAEVQPEGVVRGEKRGEQQHDRNRSMVFPCDADDLILRKEAGEERKPRKRQTADQHQRSRL